MIYHSLIFTESGVNAATFSEKQKKCSQKATKQRKRAAVKGCMIRGRHKSLHNKGKEQPKGCKYEQKRSRLC